MRVVVIPFRRPTWRKRLVYWLKHRIFRKPLPPPPDLGKLYLITRATEDIQYERISPVYEEGKPTYPLPDEVKN